MGAINHYTHYVMCGEKVDQAAVWLSDCLCGSTGLDLDKESLLAGVDYLKSSSDSYTTFHMKSRDSKTSLCAALAVYAAFQGTRVYYVPAYRASRFLNMVEMARMSSDIDDRRWFILEDAVTVGKARIQEIRNLAKVEENSLILFDDFEHNKNWNPLRVNKTIGVGFRSLGGT